MKLVSFSLWNRPSTSITNPQSVKTTSCHPHIPIRPMTRQLKILATTYDGNSIQLRYGYKPCLDPVEHGQAGCRCRASTNSARKVERPEPPRSDSSHPDSIRPRRRVRSSSTTPSSRSSNSVFNPSFAYGTSSAGKDRKNPSNPAASPASADA
jgi:hypothetical protein